MTRLLRTFDRWSVAVFVVIALAVIVVRDWPDVPPPQDGPVLVTDRLVKGGSDGR